MELAIEIDDDIIVENYKCSSFFEKFKNIF
jgi:hypothetical protein